LDRRNQRQPKTREVNMTKQTNARRFRILIVGGAKARTNDQTSGENLEADKSEYQ
jgi:hypothetical protein